MPYIINSHFQNAASLHCFVRTTRKLLREESILRKWQLLTWPRNCILGKPKIHYCIHRRFCYHLIAHLYVCCIREYNKYIMYVILFDGRYYSIHYCIHARPFLEFCGIFTKMFRQTPILFVRRDISVGIATRYGLGGLGMETGFSSRSIKAIYVILSTVPRLMRATVPIHLNVVLLIQCVINCVLFVVLLSDSGKCGFRLSAAIRIYIRRVLYRTDGQPLNPRCILFL